MQLWPLAVAPFVVKVLVRATSPLLLVAQVVFSPQHLAEWLTPYPLPTKDHGVLRTIGDARAYMHCRRSASGLIIGNPPIAYS